MYKKENLSEKMYEKENLSKKMYEKENLCKKVYEKENQNLQEARVLCRSVEGGGGIAFRWQKRIIKV